MDPDTLKFIILKLIAYCQKEDWKGYDPYDALNSPILKYIPFLDSKWPRIAFTQFMKRIPVNLRPLLGIPKTENPKAIALFLMSFIKLRKLGLLENDNLINLMAQKLISLRSLDNLITRNTKLVTRNPSNSINSINPMNPSNPSNSSNSNNSTNSTNSYWCWGYSFPWQTRTVLVPRDAPNLVCTTFVTNALLDMYEFTNDPQYLLMAKSAGEYILNELYWEYDDSIASFSYPLPRIHTSVHNANFLGSALLSRLYDLTKEEKFLNIALKVTRYSISKQNPDGSWYYGEHPSQHWIDNFHTGYNLCALKQISKYIQTNDFEINISKGFDFYLKNLFSENKIPKYYQNKLYPIDIHSITQSIITLLTLKDYYKDYEILIDSIIQWVINNMWDEKEGYFYYQSNKLLKKKIPFMRWSQAWMLLALTNFIEYNSLNNNNSKNSGKLNTNNPINQSSLNNQNNSNNSGNSFNLIKNFNSNNQNNILTYVLITPARNEAKFIELTIKSVTAQTVKPIRWIIVSDGSIDGTDDIVKKYLAHHKWIELVRMPERKERHFGGKVHAFNAGYSRVKGLKYDVIGNLDADVSFDDPDYFNFLLKKFIQNPSLGIAGTPFVEDKKHYDYRFTNIEHVSGACQLFRRKCFEEIGGYIPLEVGGIDLVAGLTARMKGWQTRTFTEKTCTHHKKTQFNKNNKLLITFKSGYHDYLMGGSAIWQLLRSIYQMAKKPYFIGGGALLAGYLWALVKRADYPIPRELVEFRRKEQMKRLRFFFNRIFKF